jgi:hypothetical protein
VGKARRSSAGRNSADGDVCARHRSHIRVIRETIRRESEGHYQPTEAQIFHKIWPTASKPALVSAADGRKYVVKGSQNTRMLFSEYVCARLGHLINAPTVELAFVDVAALRQSEPQMAHFGAGLALGSIFVSDASDRIDGIQHVGDAGNKSRFAGLALLYAWARGSDCQFIYKVSEPRLVYSNDHGHFFPGANGWSIASLAADNDVTPHGHFAACGFVAADFAAYRPLVAAVAEEDIRMIVSAPPAEWSVPAPDRDAMAQYLLRRRARVETLYA